MSNLRDNPVHVSDNVWYYEEAKGINIYFDNGNTNFIIPWKRLLESTRRKYDSTKSTNEKGGN